MYKIKKIVKFDFKGLVDKGEERIRRGQLLPLHTAHSSRGANTVFPRIRLRPINWLSKIGKSHVFVGGGVNKTNQTILTDMLLRPSPTQ